MRATHRGLLFYWSIEILLYLAAHCSVLRNRSIIFFDSYRVNALIDHTLTHYIHMRKFLKITGYLLLVLVIGIAGLLTYLKTMLPNVGEAPTMVIEQSQPLIDRGKYLAHHVMVCMDCHSTRDWSKYAGPPVDGTWGKGGEDFNQMLGFPGSFVAPNITPFGISDWTDGEVFRAVTSGVSKDGRALFPVMPHTNYGKLDENDIKSVIAYLRTLEPIENTPKASVADFPMNFIINTIPQKAQLSKMPETTNMVDYGKYMLTAAACFDCHTKQDKGKFVGEPYAGGFEFRFPDGSKTISANITPHATGIGHWTQEQFVRRFKQYADSSYTNPTVAPGEFQTVMPWTMYAGMTEQDLAAMYQYLKTVAPVDNAGPRFVPAQ